MFMSSPVKERSVIDIKQTAAAHIDIASDLLALHGLSGADTVSAIHGIGKTTVINLAKKGELSLSNVGNFNVDMEVVIAQATKFICSAYGQTVAACDSMTECRVKLWHLKTGKSGTKSIKLKALPPTSSAFIEHVNRAHMQVAIWKSALQDCPPGLDPTEYGWEIDHQGTLIPRIAQQGTLFAPPYILRLIRCQCKTSECRTAACNCANIGCTMFCLCEGGALCKNPHTQKCIYDDNIDNENDETDS